MSTALYLPLPPTSGLLPPSLQCHHDAHFPLWHLFVHEAGSGGNITGPSVRAPAPCQRVAHRVNAGGPEAARRKERHKCHTSLFFLWWFLPLPWAPPFHSALFPSRTSHSTPKPPGGLSLPAPWNPHESLITDFNPDTKWKADAAWQILR